VGGECEGCGGHGETGPGVPPLPGQRVATVAVPGVMIVGDDGQPREAVIGEAILGPCPDCNGTGHNLRGVLPELEWGPAIRRRYFDSLAHAPGTPGSPWLRQNAGWISSLQKSWELPDPALSIDPDTVAAITRCVPRGEHRTTCDHDR